MEEQNREEINKHVSQCYIDIEKNLNKKLRLLGIYSKEELKQSNNKLTVEILNHPNDPLQSLQTYIIDGIEILQVQWKGLSMDIYDAWTIEQEKGDLTKI